MSLLIVQQKYSVFYFHCPIFHHFVTPWFYLMTLCSKPFGSLESKIGVHKQNLLLLQEVI